MFPPTIVSITFSGCLVEGFNETVTNMYSVLTYYCIKLVLNTNAFVVCEIKIT